MSSRVPQGQVKLKPVALVDNKNMPHTKCYVSSGGFRGSVWWRILPTIAELFQKTAAPIRHWSSSPSVSLDEDPCWLLKPPKEEPSTSRWALVAKNRLWSLGPWANHGARCMFVDRELQQKAESSRRRSSTTPFTLHFWNKRPSVCRTRRHLGEWLEILAQTRYSFVSRTTPRFPAMALCALLIELNLLVMSRFAWWNIDNVRSELLVAVPESLFSFLQSWGEGL